MNQEADKEDQDSCLWPRHTEPEDVSDRLQGPAEKPEEPGETDETANPDGIYAKGDVIDTSKKDEATGEDGQDRRGHQDRDRRPPTALPAPPSWYPDAEAKTGDPSVVGKDQDPGQHHHHHRPGHRDDRQRPRPRPSHQATGGKAKASGPGPDRPDTRKG